MSYDYSTHRERLFTDEGQKLFIKIRDKVHELIESSGSIRMQEAITPANGDVWDLLACVDRMVELGELREIPTDGPGQHRLFVKAD